MRNLRFRWSLGALAAALLVLAALGVSFWTSASPSAAAQVPKNPKTIRSCPADNDAACLPKVQVPPVAGISALATDEQESLRKQALNRLGAVKNFPANSHPEIVSLKMRGNWAVIDAVWSFNRSNQPVPSEPLRLIAFKGAAGWRLALFGTPQFFNWVDRVPVSLISSAEKAYLKQFQKQ